MALAPDVKDKWLRGKNEATCAGIFVSSCFILQLECGKVYTLSVITGHVHQLVLFKMW